LPLNLTVHEAIEFYHLAIIINHLQIGHTRATHAHLLGDDDEAVCTKQYHFGSTLKDLFNNTSVNNVAAFIKDTHM